MKKTCEVVSKMIKEMFLDLAIGKEPFIVKMINKAGKEKVTSPVEFREKERDWLLNQETKTVSVLADDGTRLYGHMLNNPYAKRIVIMFHGWRGTWDKDCGAIGKGFYEQDSSVLFIEQRAHGESGGEYIGFGMLERYDCKRWVEYVNGNYPDIPIYLAGVSMGAATVLMASELELPMVKGIIADCGYTSAYEMVSRFPRVMMHMKATKLVQAVNKLCKKKAGYCFNDIDITKVMKNCKIPVFFVHGKDDAFVPMEMSCRNYKACGAKKKLFLVNGADHLQSYLVSPKKYISEVKSFFNWNVTNVTNVNAKDAMPA